MGGEKFKFLSFDRYKNTNDTDKTKISNQAFLPVSQVDQNIYHSIKNSILEEVQTWKSSLSSEEIKDWNFTCCSSEEDLIHIHYLKNLDSGITWNPIVLPKELNENLRLGWQDRQYGSVVDPAKFIANKLMYHLEKSLLSCLVLDEEDNVNDDLGISNYQSNINEHNESNDYECEDGDFTACSAEDCGYCGKCSY